MDGCKLFHAFDSKISEVMLQTVVRLVSPVTRIGSMAWRCWLTVVVPGEVSPMHWPALSVPERLELVSLPLLGCSQ